MAEVCLQRVVPRFRSSLLLRAPKGHYVELNFTLKTSNEIPCFDDNMYLEFRDGYDESANLLGRFCGRNISGIVRSSGQNLWLRKSDNSNYLFRGLYRNKTTNTKVKPNLDKVLKTQYVLFNRHQSLWCPAQGAPAPVIVWRKNGTVVQNSTSVLYRLTITGENSDKYSCEVNTQDGLDKKEIRLVIERCPDRCQCTTAVGIMRSVTRVECRGEYLRDLSYNQIEELPPGVFDNNPELTILYLYENQIAQLPPGVFSYNTKLIRLDLDDNQIKELPPGVFANNTKLTVLYLFGNQIQKLPAGVFNNNSELTELYVLSHYLPSEVCRAVRKHPLSQAWHQNGNVSQPLTKKEKLHS